MLVYFTVDGGGNPHVYVEPEAAWHERELAERQADEIRHSIAYDARKIRRRIEDRLRKDCRFFRAVIELAEQEGILLR